MEGKGRVGFHGFQRFPPTPNAGNVNMNNTNGDEANGQLDSVCMVREQDRYMPIANVIRIMRRILPSHAKISDDAKETIQECVSEFISFITSEANERCQREQRKTITAEDVLWSMGKLGFDDYIPSLSVFLHRFRELEGERCMLRADPVPMVKRGMDMLLANTPYAPAFHIAPHQGPLNANGNANSAQLPLPCYDPMAFAPYR